MRLLMDYDLLGNTFQRVSARNFGAASVGVEWGFLTPRGVPGWHPALF